MKDVEQPLVTVLTPVYNGADYLAECIESVLKQTYTNFEYIIVNNCSEDRTLEIARDYATKDSRIRIHDNEKFVGVIENHNNAFRMMSPKAKYCKVVSADDFIFPDCIRQMVALAEAHPEVGLVGCYLLAGTRVLCAGLDINSTAVDGREISRATLLGGPYVFGAPTNLLYRSDFVRKKTDFYPHRNPHADTTACYEVLEQSQFGFVHQVLAWARIHSESQTSNSIKAGTINVALLGDLFRFGPRYLSKAEMKHRSAFLMDSYHRVVANALVEQSDWRKFLRERSDALEAIGIRFRLAKFLRTFIWMGIKLAIRPKTAARRLYGIGNPEKRFEAKYY